MSDANFIINSINGVLEMLVALNQDIEQKAWDLLEDHAGMSGERPVAAHSLAKQKTDQLAVSESKLSTPTMVPEPVVALEDVRGVLAELSAQGYTAKVRELIVEAGAHKLSAVDPSKFSWMLAKAKEIADGAV